MYSLTPAVAALFAVSSSTNPRPPFRHLMLSLLMSAFRWWVPSIVRSFVIVIVVVVIIVSSNKPVRQEQATLKP
jgi:hypothetical protein